MAQLFVQRQPRSDMVRELTRSLMQGPGLPAYGAAGAIANVGAPIAGAALDVVAKNREERREKAETTQLGRLLAEAAEAQREGQDPLQAATAYMEANEGEPGVTGAGRAFMGMYQKQLAERLFSRETPDPFTLSPGQVRYGPGGEEIASVPAKPESETALIRNMRAGGIDPASPQGQDLIRKNLTRAQTQVNVGRPITLSPGQIAVSPDTGEEIARGEPKRQDFKEGQTKAAGFADRMRNAEQTLQELEQAGFEPGTAGEAALRAVPGGNFLLSAAQQQYRQAQEDWVRAVLRKESGAAIGVDEMANEIKAFFPQPGDGPEVQEQKAAARRRRTAGLIRESQGAYEALFGEPPAAEPATTVPEPSEAPGEPVAEAPKISSMSAIGIQQMVDEAGGLEGLTAEQRKQVDERLKALGF